MTEADANLELGDQGLGPARCSLWWRQPVAAPGLGPLVGADPAPIGCIGRLEAPGAAISKTLLEQACAELGQRGCRLVLAPMDGDTWQPYRVLDSDQDPGQAIAGEPDLALHWGGAGWPTPASGCRATLFLPYAPICRSVAPAPGWRWPYGWSRPRQCR